jgi:site-specific recombinase XerD
MSLNVSDIQLQRRRAIIRTEKSRGWRPIREIFWTDGTNKNIENWMEKREHLTLTMEFKDPEALFVSVCNQKNGQRFSLKGVGEMLRRYSNRAEIPCMNAHSFRHHMGHDIIKQGGSSADVMNILGHASVQSSSIYTMMTDRELETRYRKFKGK